jgi:hypothetical protein
MYGTISRNAIAEGNRSLGGKFNVMALLNEIDRKLTGTSLIVLRTHPASVQVHRCGFDLRLGRFVGTSPPLGSFLTVSQRWQCYESS